MKKVNLLFEKFAGVITEYSGSSYAFIAAFLVVFVWAVTGPVFNFSETWQLVINTGTTIITFLMVFLIQKSQNKESRALHIKLNELVASHIDASNTIISVEELSEDEMKVLTKFYRKLSLLSKKEHDLRISHSIREAELNHEEKKKSRGGVKKLKPKKKIGVIKSEVKKRSKRV